MSSLKADIFNLIMTRLAAPYRRKDIGQNETGDGQWPGNWFGLQEVSCSTDGNDLLTIKFSYRMDDELCEALEVPKGTLCAMTEVDGKVTGLHIENFNHSPAGLARIMQNLPGSIFYFQLRA